VQLSFQRIVPLGMLVVSGASVPWMLWSPKGVQRLESLQADLAALEAEAASLEREIERSRYRAESIKTSPRSIERVARDELGLVRQTELVVQFER
jgi:cell division protein FtsB